MFMQTAQAAKALGYHQQHITRLARQGRIPAKKLPGGFTARWLVDVDALRALISVRRGAGTFDQLEKINGVASEETKYEELNRRAMTIAAIRGPEPVRDLLLKHGAPEGLLSLLPPEKYGKFRHDLIALARVSKLGKGA
jgi:hypothetical protein